VLEHKAGYHGIPADEARERDPEEPASFVTRRDDDSPTESYPVGSNGTSGFRAKIRR
jgi:hypothetical protein